MQRYINLLFITVLLLAGGLTSSVVWAEDPPPLLWSQTYDGGSFNDWAYHVAVDANGNIIVVGSTNENWLVCKYDPAGNLMWSRSYDSGGFDYAYGVTVDAVNNIIVVGFGGLIRKYSPDGTLQWSQTSCSQYLAYDVAVDVSGNIIVVGTGFNMGGSDWMICKYDPIGNLLWSQNDGSEFLEDWACSVAVDANNNIVAVGNTYNGTNYDWLIRKYASDGTLQWSQACSGGNWDGVMGVAIDASNNIIAVGSTTNADDDWLIRKYGPDGTLLWSQTYDDNSYPYGKAVDVAIDSSSNIIVPGNSNGGWLIRKYGTEGTLLWNQTYGNGSAFGVALDGDNNVIVVGGGNGDWLIRKYGVLSNTTVTPAIDNPTPKTGDTVCVQVDVADVSDLYAASFDLAYNPAVLDYTGVTEGTFLSSGGVYATSLQVSPLNGDENSGQMVVGLSRIGDVPGATGSGRLVTLCFQVIGAYCSATDLTFSNASLETPVQGGEISAVWNGGTLTVTLGAPANPVTLDAGTHNQINFCWDAVAGAAEYEVYRSNTPGVLGELISTTSATCYSDTSCILPTLNYYYQVRAIAGSGACVSEYSIEVAGLAAGILGDINNDGRVDGRDLSRLGRAFGSSCGALKYDCRADMNRSCLIDGEDLILLAADFGKTL